MLSKAVIAVLLGCTTILAYPKLDNPLFDTHVDEVISGLDKNDVSYGHGQNRTAAYYVYKDILDNIDEEIRNRPATAYRKLQSAATPDQLKQAETELKKATEQIKFAVNQAIARRKRVSSKQSTEPKKLL